jgi:hypothetical protein
MGTTTMQTVRIVYWEEDGAWLGYLQDYPDYWSQGETLDDLKEHLRDLYGDIASAELPGIRKVEECAELATEVDPFVSAAGRRVLKHTDW